MTLIQHLRTFAGDARLTVAAKYFGFVGDTQKLERALRQQVTNRLRFLSADHIDVARAKFKLADRLFAGNKQQRSEAAQLLAQVLPVFERRYGSCSFETGQVLHRLGTVRHLDGDTSEAEALYRAAHVMFTHHAPRWLLEHADVCEHLAAILFARQSNEAQDFRDEAQDIRWRHHMVTIGGRYGRYLYA